MNARLLIIILIGVIASAVTYHFTNSGDGSGSGGVALLNTPPKAPGRTTTKASVTTRASQDLPEKRYSATGRKEARLISSAEAGQKDPFAPIDTVLNSAGLDKSAKIDLPPPPETGGDNGLLPPPPAMGGADFGSNLPPEPQADAGISVDELPNPPTSQSLRSKLSLNAILGDKAVLALKDKAYASSHGLKQFVTLGKGDSYESVRLVYLDDARAVIEEEGNTRELRLPEIR